MVYDMVYHARSVSNRYWVAELVCTLHCYHFYDRGRYPWIFTTVNVPVTFPTPKVGNRYG